MCGGRSGVFRQVCGFKYVRFYERSQSLMLYRTTKPWSQQRRWAPSADEAKDEEQARGSALPRAAIRALRSSHLHACSVTCDAA